MMRTLKSTLKRTYVGLLAAVFVAAYAAIAILPATSFAAANLNQNSKNITGVQNSTKDKEDVDEDEDNQKPADDNISVMKAVKDVGSVLAEIKSTGSPSIKEASDEHKITLCHRTASYSNPYVVITVDKSAADGLAGNSNSKPDHYGEHQGPVFYSTIPKHTEWGDIIPPIEGVHNGMNWSTAGQSIYNNGCATVSNINDPEQPQEPEENEDKVTLCHATGSETNPFVKITIAPSAAYHAHINHQDEEDIVPPFEYKDNTYSLNWTPENQVIYNDDCNTGGTVISDNENEGGKGSGVVLDENIDQPGKGEALANTGSGAGIMVAVLSGLGLVTLSGSLMFATRTKLEQ